jgi:hypothetical protein
MMARFSRPRLGVPAAVMVFGAAVALAGCADDSRTLNCPGVAILADAAIRPVLKAGAVPTDPSAVLYTVQATNIETSCKLDRRRGQTDSDVSLSFRATRPPSGQPAHYVVPYFLAINQGERVINKRMFSVVIDFAPGASSVTVQTAINNSVLNLDNGHLPMEYQFLVGMQLSADEQVYLKAVGPYAP